MAFSNFEKKYYFTLKNKTKKTGQLYLFTFLINSLIIIIPLDSNF